jgi:hypothetical protein
MPSPHSIETDRLNEKIESSHASIRRNKDESIRLKCLLYPQLKVASSVDQIQWQYSIHDTTYADLPDKVYITNNELIIDHVKDIHRGYYRCQLNDISLTVLLRVKGMYDTR